MDKEIAFIYIEIDELVIAWVDGRFKRIDEPSEEYKKNIIKDNKLIFIFTEKENRGRSYYFNELHLDEIDKIKENNEHIVNCYFSDELN